MKRIPSIGLAFATLVLACSSPSSDAPFGDDAREDAPRWVTVGTDEDAAEAPAASAPSLATSLVFHAGGRTFVALDEHPDLSLAVDAPALVGDTKEHASETQANGMPMPPERKRGRHEGVVAVSRAVDPARLGKERFATIGTRVHLRGAKGGACDAIVEGLSFVGRVAPSGETELSWSGEARDDDGAKIAAPSHAAIAEEAWDLADGSIVLAASLRPIGSCKDATYMVNEAATTGEPPRPADDATTRDALVAMRALPEYATHAAEYLDFAKDTDASQTAPRWENHAEATPRVSTITVGATDYVFVAAGTASGCGDFGAELSVLFRKTTDGGLEVVRVLDGFTADIEALVEGSDGAELVFPEVHVGPKDADVRRLEVRTFGCSC